MLYHFTFVYDISGYAYQGKQIASIRARNEEEAARKLFLWMSGHERFKYRLTDVDMETFIESALAEGGLNLDTLTVDFTPSDDVIELY